jgi:hypothetical protein
MSNNTNCLEGLRCPTCLQEDKLLVRTTSWVAMTDDGTDPYDDDLKYLGEIEWDDDTMTGCPQCGHKGVMGEFREDRRNSKAASPGQRDSEHTGMPMVLVEVRGGNVKTSSRGDVDVQVVDYDNLNCALGDGAYDGEVLDAADVLRRFGVATGVADYAAWADELLRNHENLKK